jgi:predicted outer membrane protein
MNILQRVCIFLSLPLALLPAVGCGDGNGHKDDRDTVAAAAAEAGIYNEKDEEFVEDMLGDNAKAMAWLKAGAAMGTDAQLKKDAATMLTDHETMDRRFRELAATKSYRLDDVDKDDSTTDAADDRRGAGWDDDWAGKMKDLHEKMTGRMTDYSDDARDADLRALINEMMPGMNRRLTMSRALDERIRD